MQFILWRPIEKRNCHEKSVGFEETLLVAALLLKSPHDVSTRARSLFFGICWVPVASSKGCGSLGGFRIQNNFASHLASPTWWTCVWASFGSWWWTGKPGIAAVHGIAKRQTWLSDWTDWTATSAAKWSSRYNKWVTLWPQIEAVSSRKLSMLIVSVPCTWRVGILDEWV